METIEASAVELKLKHESTRDDAAKDINLNSHSIDLSTSF